MARDLLAEGLHDLSQTLAAAELLEHALTRAPDAERARALAGDLLAALAATRAMVRRLGADAAHGRALPTPRLTSIETGPFHAALLRELAPLARARGTMLRGVAVRTRVTSDPQLLGRMVRNLAINAIEAAPGGKVLIGWRRRGTDLRLEIWDDGPGFDAKATAGLGLGLVRRLAAVLGHRFEIAGRAGGGTCAALVLALRRLRAVRVRRRPVTDRGRSSRRNGGAQR